MIKGDQPYGTKPLDSAAVRLAFEDALARQPKALEELLRIEAESSRKLRIKDADSAWLALALLATEAELPIRLVTIEALVAIAADDASAEMLMQQAAQWLEVEDDREFRFGAAAAVITVLSNTRVLTALRDHEVVLDYVSKVIAMVEDAPRSAERSDARRRIVRGLPATLLAIMARMARVTGERGVQWLARECELAKQPQLREALSDVIVRLRKDSLGVGRAAVEQLSKTLAASAAPLRDGAEKLQRPGTGRGRSSRRIR